MFQLLSLSIALLACLFRLVELRCAQQCTRGRAECAGRTLHDVLGLSLRRSTSDQKGLATCHSSANLDATIHLPRQIISNHADVMDKIPQPIRPQDTASICCKGSLRIVIIRPICTLPSPCDLKALTVSSSSRSRGFSCVASSLLCLCGGPSLCWFFATVLLSSRVRPCHVGRPSDNYAMPWSWTRISANSTDKRSESAKPEFILGSTQPSTCCGS